MRSSRRFLVRDPRIIDAIGVFRGARLALYVKPRSADSILWGARNHVTNPTYDPKKLQEYRERAAGLYDLSKEVEQRIHTAAESGDIKDARAAMGELNLRTKEFEDFRKTLTPAEFFLATYNVEVINDHTVSFVIPKGVSRIDILQEAKELVTDRDLIYPSDLAKWEKDPKFTTDATNSERICIDGHMPKSLRKTRAEQEAMVGRENLPTLEDLAVAFAVNWIATKEPLFGWYDKAQGWAYVVRAVGGALYFHSDGLSVHALNDAGSSAGIAVASRAPGIRKLDSGYSDSGLRGLWTLAKRGLGFGS